MRGRNTSVGLLCLAQLLVLASAFRIEVVDTVHTRSFQKRAPQPRWPIYNHTDADLDRMVGHHVVTQRQPHHGIDMQLELPLDGRNFIDEALDKTLYISKIKLNGKDLVVALDPTFSDFWVDADLGDGVQDLHVSTALYHGHNRHYRVKGTVSVAPLAIGSYKVDHQAFVKASSTNMGDVSKMKINGILGLDIPLAGHSVAAAAIHAHAEASANARYASSFTKNILHHVKDDHKFVVISLSDPADPNNPSVLSIGEHPVDGIDTIMSHLKKEPLPLAAQKKWSANVSGLKIGKHTLHFKAAHGRKGGNEGVAWIDPSTPNIKLPAHMVDELYKNVPGAEKLVLEEGGVANGESLWSVPCDTKVLFELHVGGSRIAISPLQLSDLEVAQLEDGSEIASCISSIVGIPADAASNKEYDVVLGAGFFRNAYTVFGYPSQSHPEPWMQFRALHTDEQAVAFVQSIRMKQVKQYDQELEHVIGGKKPSANGKPSANKNDDSTLDGISSFNAANSLTGTSSADYEGLKKLAIGGIALLSLNAILALAAVVVGVLIYIKKSANGGGAPKGVPHYIPVKLGAGTAEDESRAMNAGAGYRDTERGYGTSGV